jgi:hypothetical protein
VAERSKNVVANYDKEGFANSFYVTYRAVGLKVEDAAARMQAARAHSRYSGKGRPAPCAI